jgi:hypothetical protein
VRHTGCAFTTKSEAWAQNPDVVEPELHGRPAPKRHNSQTELADTFLERHTAKPRTITTLRGGLTRPLDKFGETPLSELEHMTDELAGFAAQLPERYRYFVMSALRQTCEAGACYGYMTRNPAKIAGSNPMPAPRAVRVYTPKELEAITNELDKRATAAITFAAATGLRPAE